MKNNNKPNKNIFDTSFVKPEDVFVSDDRTKITIMQTTKSNDYCLYDMSTAEQVTPWVNGKEGKVVFTDLNPEIKYAIRVKKADIDTTHEINYIHSLPLFDDKNNKIVN